MNAQGLINEETKWKIDFFKEYVKVNNLIIMNYTETWFKEEDQDVGIPDYTVFRSDRKGGKTKGGGAAIYLRDGFEAKVLLEDYVESCEIVAIHIEKVNILNVVVYRPPDTKLSVFSEIINKINRLLSETETLKPKVIITGDYNFPFIQWKRSRVGACSWSMKPGTYATEDEKNQFFRLMEIADKYNLVQAIEEPTRGKNTLDLVFTNEIDAFKQVEVTETSMSDHKIIEITTDIEWNKDNIDVGESRVDMKEDDLRQLNFHSEKIPWSEIGQILNELDWDKIFKGRNVEECTCIFIEIIKTICFKIVPRKSIKSKNKIPRERKMLLNRIKMLKRKKHNSKKLKDKRKIEENIIETEKILTAKRTQEKYINEKKR